MSTYSIPTAQGAIACWDSNPAANKRDPTVLFIHGHCTDKQFFYPQMESPLFNGYRLICIDLPGYGKSEKPRNPEKVYNLPGFAESVAMVVKYLELKNFMIVGWSLGGHVALESTSLFDQLKGLLIFGTPPIEISAEGLGKGFKIANPKILECFGKGNLSESEAELFATLAGYDYTSQKRYMVDAVLNTDEGAKIIYPQSILKGIGHNELAIVSHWSKPIAVLGGEADAGINNDYIINEVKFRNLWNRQVYLIPNAGHAVQLDQPEIFNRLLRQFLDDIFHLGPITEQNNAVLHFCMHNNLYVNRLS